MGSRRRGKWIKTKSNHNHFRKKFDQMEWIGMDSTAAGMDLLRNSVAIVAKTCCRLNEDTKGRNGNNLRSSDPEWVLCPLSALPHFSPKFLNLSTFWTGLLCRRTAGHVFHLVSFMKTFIWFSTDQRSHATGGSGTRICAWMQTQSAGLCCWFTECYQRPSTYVISIILRPRKSQTIPQTLGDVTK